MAVTPDIYLEFISFMCKKKILQNKRVPLFLVLRIVRYVIYSIATILTTESVG